MAVREVAGAKACWKVGGVERQEASLKANVGIPANSSGDYCWDEGQSHREEADSVKFQRAKSML